MKTFYMEKKEPPKQKLLKRLSLLMLTVSLALFLRVTQPKLVNEGCNYQVAKSKEWPLPEPS
jgi:hypothetical protein